MSVKENGTVFCEDRFGGPCEICRPCTTKCRKEHRLMKERRRWNKKRLKEEVDEYYDGKLAS